MKNKSLAKLLFVLTAVSFGFLFFQDWSFCIDGMQDDGKEVSITSVQRNPLDDEKGLRKAESQLQAEEEEEKEKEKERPAANSAQKIMSYTRIQNVTQECSSQAAWGLLERWKDVDATNLCPTPKKNQSRQSAGFAQSMMDVSPRDRKHASLIQLYNVSISLENGHAMVGFPCEAPPDFSSVFVPAFVKFDASLPACDDSNDELVHHPVILMYRYDAHNTYHTTESFVGALETTLTLGVDPDEVSILFIDNAPAHQLDEMFLSVFGNLKLGIDPYILRSKGPFKRCFQRAMISLTDRTGSVVTKSFLRTNPCASTGNPMVDSFTNYCVDRLGLTGISPPKPSKGQVLRVLWMDRRDYGDRQLQRKVTPESLKQLKDAVLHGNAAKGGAANYSVEFIVWDPHGSTFSSQMEMVRSSNILIGVHGAALTHLVFQPDECTGIIELQPHGYGTLHEEHVANIFINLAKWKRRKYVPVHDCPLPVLDSETVEKVNHAIHSMLREISSRNGC